MLLQIQQSLQKLLAKLNSWLDSLVLALPNLILATLVLVSSLYLARFLKKGVRKALRKTSGNPTVVSVVSNVAVAGFMIVVLFVALSILNLDDAFTALLGTAGVIGLAVGLALQDPLINLFSGILMSVRDKYSLGDLVETNGYFGTIQKINLRSTILRQATGQEVVIPNKEVIQNPLVNYTRSGERRVDLECGISYGEDLEEVQEVAVEAIRQAGIDLMKQKDIDFFYVGFGDSSINFIVRYWFNGTAQRDFLKARSLGVMALKKSFDRQGITIPFPIRTLDFGIVGGVRLDDLYPSQRLTVVKKQDGDQN